MVETGSSSFQPRGFWWNQPQQTWHTEIARLGIHQEKLQHLLVEATEMIAQFREIDVRPLDLAFTPSKTILYAGISKVSN